MEITYYYLHFETYFLDKILIDFENNLSFFCSRPMEKTIYLHKVMKFNFNEITWN